MLKIPQLELGQPGTAKQCRWEFKGVSAPIFFALELIEEARSSPGPLLN